MVYEDPYQSWKRSRQDVPVPDGFADRVMASLDLATHQNTQLLRTGWLCCLLTSRLGRLAACVSAATVCLLRIGHVFSLFVVQ